MTVSLYPAPDASLGNHYNPPSGLRGRYLSQEQHTTPYQAALRRDAALLPLNLDSVVQTADEGPDIQWHPSYETYQRRVAALAACGLERETKLPEEYPECVSEPWAWSGGGLGEERYVLCLEEEDVGEIEQALAYFKGNPLC
jgi:hypothetical protein